MASKTTITMIGTDNLNVNPTGVNAASTVSSNAMDLTGVDSLSIQVVFPTASSLTGTLSFQFSNYPFSGVIPSYGWTNSSAYPSVVYTGINAATSYLLDIAKINYKYVQVLWTPSAGTGTILALADVRSL